MTPMPSKLIRCAVITGPVTAVLQRRRSRRTGHGELFVRCSERDCQFVDVNEHPCPLTLDMFSAEIPQGAARPHASPQPAAKGSRSARTRRSMTSRVSAGTSTWLSRMGTSMPTWPLAALALLRR